MTTYNEELRTDKEHEIAVLYKAMSGIQAERNKLDCEYERLSDGIVRLRRELAELGCE